MKHARRAGVSNMMKNLLFVIVLIGCGSKQSTPVSNGGGSADNVGPARDTRSELERRRDAACETLGPRITTCAIEDAKKDLAAGKTSKQQFDQDTAPAVRDKNTSEFIKQCQAAHYSSRQVRVLEVCPKEESQCEPLLSCLENLNQKQ